MTDHREPTTAFTDAEKSELLTIITQIRGAGIKLNSVAAATGINYKAFMNKVKDLELRQTGKESTLKNNFTRKNYDAIKTWWADFRQKMSA